MTEPHDDDDQDRGARAGRGRGRDARPGPRRARSRTCALRDLRAAALLRGAAARPRASTRRRTSPPGSAASARSPTRSSACEAMEDALGIEVDEPVRALRRLIYCGEWIESHALHVFMLHAPDFLGYESGVEMAARPPRAGRARARDQEGGQPADRARSAAARSTRSTSASAASTARPTAAELAPVRAAARARPRDTLIETVRWAGELDFPELDARLRARRRCARSRGGEYPIEGGRLVSTAGLDIAPGRVPRARRRGAGPALDRAARADSRPRHLPARAAGALRAQPRPALAAGARAAAEPRGSGPACRNPFKSILVRAVEILYAARRGAADHRRLRAARPARGRRPSPRAGDRPRLDRGAARDAVAPLRARRPTAEIAKATDRARRPRRTSASIEEDLREFVQANARAPRRRAAAALRAGDPQLRPLHLLLDPLPAPGARSR